MSCISGSVGGVCMLLRHSLCQSCSDVFQSITWAEWHHQAKMHFSAIENFDVNVLTEIKSKKYILDSNSYRQNKELSSLFCRDPSLSIDRQNSATDPCLQAGIMPGLIEIFDSNPRPVWSWMPPYCACIFSGLQVSGHDSALGTWTQIKWTITHNLIELSFPAHSLSLFFTNLTVLCSFTPFYVPTIDSCCDSLRNIIKTRLIPVSSIIYSLWKHDLGALLFVCSDNVSLLWLRIK